MNTNPVFSISSNGELEPFRRVKLGASGVEYAGATDAHIGTTLAGDLNRGQAAVQSKSVGIHNATTSSATAIAAGDEIEGGADGKVKKLSTGTAIGVAVEAVAESDAEVRVIYY